MAAPSIAVPSVPSEFMLSRRYGRRHLSALGACYETGATCGALDTSSRADELPPLSPYRRRGYHPPVQPGVTAERDRLGHDRTHVRRGVRAVLGRHAEPSAFSAGDASGRALARHSSRVITWRAPAAGMDSRAATKLPKKPPTQSPIDVPIRSESKTSSGLTLAVRLMTTGLSTWFSISW